MICQSCSTKIIEKGKIAKNKIFAICVLKTITVV